MTMVTKERSNIRVKRNGESLQVFRGMDYIGSISLTDLCQLLGLAKQIGTGRILAQINAIGESEKNGAFGTKI